VLEIVNAGFCAYCEPGRDLYAQGGHLGKVGAFPPQEIFHFCVTLGIFIPKGINIFLRHKKNLPQLIESRGRNGEQMECG